MMQAMVKMDSWQCLVAMKVVVVAVAVSVAVVIRVVVMWRMWL